MVVAVVLVDLDHQSLLQVDLEHLLSLPYQYQLKHIQLLLVEVVQSDQVMVLVKMDQSQHSQL
jgi:hypothetical protein